MTPPYLNQIILYPIKSLAGISVNQWPVTTRGLQYDRQWMLVDSQGNFLSQRRLPKMSLIKTAIIEHQLILSASGFENLTLSLTPKKEEERSVSIWNDQCLSWWISKTADDWLSDVLHFKCQLVYQPQHHPRLIDQEFGTATDQIYFSDGFPFLIISENSLTHLNSAMNLSLPMSRFRPNLVITNCPSYAEDFWREIQIGEISFRLPKPCSRCAITTIDTTTGLMGKEPLTTLNKLRKWNNQVFFGQNAIHDNGGVFRTESPLIVNRQGLQQPPINNDP